MVTRSAGRASATSFLANRYLIAVLSTDNATMADEIATVEGVWHRLAAFGTGPAGECLT